MTSATITAAKEIDITLVAQRLGLDEPVRGKIRCISKHHRDTNPSMLVGGKLNRFKCFGCDLEGSVIDLVQIRMGLDFREAMDWLLSDSVLPASLPVPISPRLYRPATAPLQDFWELCDDTGDWLAPKGLNAGRFGIRAVTEAASALIPTFKPGGLFIPYYQHGRITYARWRNLEHWGPRFLGLPDTDVIFYNQDALAGLDGSVPLYLAEGETDTMSLTELGHVAVGFPGATQFQLLGILAGWVAALGDKIPAIVTAFDADTAGDKLHDKILSLDLPVPISRFDLQGEKDVNDLYKNLIWTN